MTAEETGARARKKRLHSKRAEAGLAQISAWVPIERRSYARDVLKAVASGANSLPPDPEIAAELAAAQTKIEQIEAEVVRQRAILEAERETARMSEAKAQEQAREALVRAEKAEAAIRQARNLPGVRGRLVRWLAGDVLE
jgi:multidrug efflux pump subunit AcrA (membrane-fusion protein)